MTIYTNNAKRPVIIGGASYPVVNEGDCFIEIPGKKLVWSSFVLKRIYPKTKKGEDGSEVLNDWGIHHYTGHDIAEIMGDFEYGYDGRCRIRMLDGEVINCSAPRITDVSDRHLVGMGINRRSSSSRNNEKAHIELLNRIDQNTSPLPKAIGNLTQRFDGLDQNIAAIATNQTELQRANEALCTLANEGFLRFATRVDAKDFQAFAVIMLTGNRNQAASDLGIPQRTFYDMVNAWPARGPDYQRMFLLVQWRKKSGRKIRVRLEDSLLGTEVKDQAENPETIRDVSAFIQDKTAAEDRDNLLRDILQAIASQNVDNWKDIKTELISILKEELPQ